MSNEESREGAVSRPLHSSGLPTFMPGPTDASGNPLFLPEKANDENLILPPPHTPESLGAVTERMSSGQFLPPDRREPFVPPLVPRREPDPTLGRKKPVPPVRPFESQQPPAPAAQEDASSLVSIKRKGEASQPAASEPKVPQEDDIAEEAEKDSRLYVPSSLRHGGDDEFGGMFGSRQSAHLSGSKVVEKPQSEPEKEYVYEAEELVAPEPEFEEPVAPLVEPEEPKKQDAAQRRQAKKEERARQALEKQRLKEAAEMEKKENKDRKKAFKISEAQRRQAEKEERKREEDRIKAEKAEQARLAKEAKRRKKEETPPAPVPAPAPQQVAAPQPPTAKPEKKQPRDTKKAKQEEALRREQELLEAHKNLGSAEIEAARHAYETVREAVRAAQRERDEALGKKGVTLAMKQRRSLNIKWGLVAVFFAVLSALGGAFVGIQYSERVIEILPFMGESSTSDDSRAIETETGTFLSISGATTQDDDCGTGLYVSALGGDAPFFLNSLRFEVNSVSVEAAESTNECPNDGVIAERTAATYFVYLDTDAEIENAAILYGNQRLEWSAP